jgi:hypothetical protein
MTPAPEIRRRIREYPWPLIAVLVTGFGILLFFYKTLDGVARQREVDWLGAFLEEMTGGYSELFMIPLVAWLVLRYPIAGHWKRRLPVYVAAGVVYSAIDTTIIYGLRLAVFSAAGRGVYDYGIMPVRYLMEMPMQLILFSTMVVVFTYVEARRSARERELRVEVLERELARAQLETLRVQLQPHFLFNALNAISAVVYEDARMADRMIGRLSEFLRAVLRSDNAQEVPLREELGLVNLYLDVMKVRFEDKLRSTVCCTGELESAMVPQLILQPVVENAIRYGADPRTGMIDVQVEARRTGQGIELTVSDGGPGCGQDSNGFGIGLKTIGERLEHLYGDRGCLAIENGDVSGTRVRIRLPFHREPVAVRV